MPRRSDDSVRVGLNSIVRWRISSKDSKRSGPAMKAAIGDAFSRSTPGVTSTSTSFGHALGVAGRVRDRGEAAERHPDEATRVRRELGDRDRERARRSRPASSGGPRASRSGRARAGRTRPAGGRARVRRCPTCARSGRRRGAGRARPVRRPTRARSPAGRRRRGPRCGARSGARPRGCRTPRRSRGTARTRRSAWAPTVTATGSPRRSPGGRRSAFVVEAVDERLGLLVGIDEDGALRRGSTASRLSTSTW